METVKTVTQGIHRYNALSSVDAPFLICWLSDSGALLSGNLNNKAMNRLCHQVLCHYLGISVE